MRKGARWFLIVCLAAGIAVPRPAASEDDQDAVLRAKIKAIDRVFDQGGEAAAKGILPSFRDRDLAVRSHAMKRMVDLGPAAVDTLIGALAEEDTRWLASGALINIGPDAVQRTVLALKHKNPIVRRNALFILRQLEARAAAPSIQAALSDPDPSVQVQAIQTVAQFGGEGAHRLVLSKVGSSDAAVREAAIEALARFGKDAVSSLSSLFSYGDPDVRIAALRALAAIGFKEARDCIAGALADGAPQVRYYACLIVGEAMDPSLLEDLGKLLEDPDPSVREAANEAIGRMPEGARPMLFRLMREGNPLQKIGAATAVRKAKYRPAVPLLIEMMRDPFPEAKLAAVAALMVLADPASVEALVNGLRDGEIRWMCIMALRQFGDVNLRPLLRRTGDPELDYWKQYVLEGMGDRVLEGCLETLKKEEDMGTRIATLCTMRQIKDTRAVYPLIRLLSDERLGFVAAFVIAQMGEVAVEPLLLSLQDEKPAVRARAATALGEIGFSRVMRPLKDLLRDGDPQVRQAAAQAIRKIGGQPGQEGPAEGPAAEPCLD